MSSLNGIFPLIGKYAGSGIRHKAAVLPSFFKKIFNLVENGRMDIYGIKENQERFVGFEV